MTKIKKMKKVFPFQLLFSTAILFHANSVTGKLFNNSNSIIKALASEIHNGSFLLKDHGSNVDKIQSLLVML